VLKDYLARQSRLPALKLDAHGAQRRRHGRLNAVVNKARVIGLHARGRLKVAAEGPHLKLWELWTVSNGITDQGGECQVRYSEGALRAEAKLRAKEDAQGILEA
jgi:hypothetical protein